MLSGMDDANERARAITFASYLLMKIKKATTPDVFYRIVDSDIILDDLIDNYGYYHRYPPAGVMELLAQREPALVKYGLKDKVR
jgi:hypothetical protein